LCDLDGGKNKMKDSATATTTITEGQKGSTIVKISRNVKFTLCNTCFWCASYLDGYGTEKCPVCNNNQVNILSLDGNSGYYSFDYGLNQRIIVDFVPRDTLA
jgi:hypothetical protein